MTDTYYHHQFIVFPFADHVSGKDWPSEEEYENAEGYGGGNPFRVEIEDNGRNGDGIIMEIHFQGKERERRVFWGRFTTAGIRHLKSVFGSILDAKDIEDNEVQDDV